MNKLIITAITAAVGIAFSSGAMAQNITKSEYKAGMTRIDTEYKSAKADCNAMSGNANDICIASAKGNMNVAKAELEAGYKPTEKSHYNIVVAKADAAFSVAKEKCDDHAGNTKDVCLKEAKASETAILADAKAQVETTAANKTANEESGEARVTANEKATDARTDATADKRDANYAVAKEKCDAFSGDAKDSCIKDAKTHYGM